MAFTTKNSEVNKMEKPQAAASSLRQQRRERCKCHGGKSMAEDGGRTGADSRFARAGVFATRQYLAKMVQGSSSVQGIAPSSNDLELAFQPSFGHPFHKCEWGREKDGRGAELCCGRRRNCE
jgi:hypothetical protein